jgi:hypothetical protein
VQVLDKFINVAPGARAGFPGINYDLHMYIIAVLAGV